MMNSKTLVAALAYLSVSGVYAGPCKPVTTSAAISTQVTSATTEQSSVIDLTTTITAADTTTETGASTTELTTTTTAAVTSDVATTTTEAASTTTGPAFCPTPIACENLGFDWAYYSNPAQNTDTTYSSFHPASFKDTLPGFVGTTRQIGGLYNAPGTDPVGPIYGSSNLALDYFALNHHGYMYACEAGTYKFNIPYANDAVYLWIGAKAYAGWTEGNADAKALYNQPDHIAGSASFEINIPANVYIPIRIVYGQAQYGGGFKFTITSPSGRILLDNDAPPSAFIVRNSCDGISAPQYPTFGTEI
ncbi:uncharacterized protein FTOL_01842 [Fusarium torulosum]|uniref:PA14 domain-containing protein n=1 Tax=Fusarium torulosum TaxID=33205 RepID=A0AAE8M0X2_9HYPO|nr:uncharacterized protein FTOL_01842 [Fusarium torulosum]